MRSFEARVKKQQLRDAVLCRLRPSKRRELDIPMRHLGSFSTFSDSCRLMNGAGNTSSFSSSPSGGWTLGEARRIDRQVAAASRQAALQLRDTPRCHWQSKETVWAS